MRELTAEEVAAKEAATAKLEKKQREKESPDPGDGFRFVAGRPLPEGYKNPPPGKPYHRCVDRENNYNPAWSALYLHKTNPNQADRQFVNHCGRKYYVQTKRWMDAPPSVIECLSVEESIVDMVPAGSVGEERPGLTMAALEPQVVEVKPRFSFNLIPSA